MNDWFNDLYADITILCMKEVIFDLKRSGYEKRTEMYSCFGQLCSILKWEKLVWKA